MISSLHPFNKILLKTPFLRAVFQNIRTAFDKYAVTTGQLESHTTNDTNETMSTPSNTTTSNHPKSLKHSSSSNGGTHGTGNSTTTSVLYLPYDQLQNVLNELGAFSSINTPSTSTTNNNTTNEEHKINLTAIFSSADIYQHQQLTFREFLVCLALGYLLGTIHLPGVPDFSSIPSNTNNNIHHHQHSSLSTSSQASTSSTSSKSNGTSPHALQNTRPSFSDSAARTLEGDTETAAAIAYEAAQKLHEEEIIASEHNTASRHPSIASGTHATDNKSIHTVKSIMRPPINTDSDNQSLPNTKTSQDSTITDLVSFSETKEQEELLRSKERLHYLSSLHNYSRRTLPTVNSVDNNNNSIENTPNDIMNKSSNKIRTSSLLTRSPSFGMNGNTCTPVDIAFAFHLVLEAYMQLDSQRKGGVSHEDLSSAMEEIILSPSGKVPHHIHHHDTNKSSNGKNSKPSSRANSPHRNAGHRSRSNSGTFNTSTTTSHSSVVDFVTNERFHELDFNADGNVSFKEFLYTFVKWCGVEEDDEDNDETKQNPHTIYNKIKNFFTKHHTTTNNNGNRSRSNSQYE